MIYVLLLGKLKKKKKGSSLPKYNSSYLMMLTQHIWLLPTTRLWEKQARMSFHLYFKFVCKAVWKKYFCLVNSIMHMYSVGEAKKYLLELA